MKKATLVIIILFAILLTTVGCSKKPKQVDINAQSQKYVDISESCRPNMSNKISAKEWAEANNSFGLKLLCNTQGNTVFSPYSIERALGMTLEGACLTTATEMLTALEMPNAKRLGISGLEVEDALKYVNSDTILEIDNSIWPDKTFVLHDNYTKRINAAYLNNVTSLDYKSNPESARVTINNYIEKATHNRISELIPEGNVTELTRLVLTNAVYFKSKWSKPFEKNNTKKALLSHNFSEQRKLRIYNGFSHFWYEIIVENFV